MVRIYDGQGAVHRGHVIAQSRNGALRCGKTRVEDRAMWTFRILGALLVAALIVVAGVLLLPADRMAAVLADQLQKQTGREVTINGQARFSLWPELAIDVGDVILGNTAWAGPEPMLTARALSAALSVPDLLSGKVRFTRLRADAPTLRLARHADGRGNWQFSETAGPGGELPPVSLDVVELTDARLVYSTPGSDPLIIGPLDAELRWPDPDKPATLNLSLPASLGNLLIVKSRISDFPAFLSGGLVPVEADLNLAGSRAEFRGRINSGGAGAGRFEAQTPNLGGLLGSGPDAAAAGAADATYTSDGQLSLRNMGLRLGENTVTGEADLRPGAPTHLTARLWAKHLDLSAYMSDQSGPATDGWSKTPIDASALGLVQGAIRLTADSLDTGTVRLGPTDATLSIDRSRGVLKLDPATVFGGRISGQLVANNRNGLSVGGKLTMTGIETEQALGDLAGYRRLSGKADGTLNFLGVGQSMDAIMRSLSGSGSLKMGQGVISGLDLDRLMGSGTGAGGTTVFDSLTGTFTMASGNLQNDDLLMSLKNFRVDGAGRIGLGTRDIDYLFTPVALRARSGQGIAIPVSVKGPWSKPKIRADLEAATKADLEAKQDEIEAEAKEKLREKLSEELEVPVTDQQSLEEALKDKLEDEAKKGLLKLLGVD
ncbi:AsmA family protein [Seohaeicola saemankumensis]|nr:AsmA family protein [Seohaeicola saemankumensis]MCA0871256.1 AsmA family protein [Seohaeicola saemankumensis]